MPDARTPTDDQLRWITTRAVAEIIPHREFVEALRSGRALRLKMGFDPSAPDLTLGHAVGLRKLRQLQELGHTVVLIVGDWTARIGDPSGQSKTRPMLTPEEVKANAETYLRQFFRIVDRERTEVRWQSEWFDPFTLADVVRLAAKFTVSQMLQRDDFAQRYAEHKPIGVHELLYPLLQAYDSVAVRADVEFGGTDQKFNLLVGRELQPQFEQPPQAVFLVPLLVGTDGKIKMSKSLGNYIAVDDPPQEMYGKLMSIPDTLVMDYLELLTDIPDEELSYIRGSLQKRDENPMDHKMRLAREIVCQFHSEEAAREAAEQFTRVFRKGELPVEGEILQVRIPFSKTPYPYSDMYRELKPIRRDLAKAFGLQTRRGITHLEVTQQAARALKKYLSSLPMKTAAPKTDVVTIDVIQFLDLLAIVDSRSEGRRLLKQGAIDVDGVPLTQGNVQLRDGSIIKAGKKTFLRIIDADRHPDVPPPHNG